VNFYRTSRRHIPEYGSDCCTVKRHDLAKRSPGSQACPCKPETPRPPRVAVASCSNAYHVTTATKCGRHVHRLMQSGQNWLGTYTQSGTLPVKDVLQAAERRSTSRYVLISSSHFIIIPFSSSYFIISFSLTFPLPSYAFPLSDIQAGR
jgi:hypothetical protein